MGAIARWLAVRVGLAFALAASGCSARRAAPVDGAERAAPPSAGGAGEEASGPSSPSGRSSRPTSGHVAGSLVEPWPPVARITVDDQSAIEQRVLDAIERGRFPGCTIAIGRHDGVRFASAYGRRAVDPAPERMTLDTVFDLASVTKPVVTATLTMRAIDAGQLTLSTRASEIWPALEGGGRERITIEQLLTHTAGFPSVNPLSDYEGTRDEALARIAATPLAQPPGAGFLYSDLSFIVLGEVLARLEGEPLDALARTQIFEPLAMSDSTFTPTDELRPRVAPTERAVRRGGIMIRGDVHDPRAFRLGGVSGNAGAFATAHDLSRYARMILGGGELDGARVLSHAARDEMVRPRDGGGRALGWDVGRTAMSDGSVGHGGFTGTLLAIDPERDQFVVFLSNRVHPDGGRRGELTGFFRELLPLLAGALERSDAVPEPRVRTGLDVLARERFAPIVGSHVALLTHDPARSVDGRRAIDVLLDAPDVELVRVLAPEHGLGADREGRIRDGRDARTGIPVRALFGPTRTPDDAMLEGVDTIVVDLVAVGVRFYTYASTVVRVLEAAAPRGLRVVILDRPEPLGGGRPRGPVSEPALASFVSYHPLPAYHGMTLGEVARLVNDERGIGAHLEVIGPDGWTRTPWGETGLRWFAPSPNLPTLEAVELYPALALIEGTNVSVGRGTDAPFARLGAPFIDPRRLIAEVGTIDGVAIEPVTFVPRSARHRRVRCRGVALRVVDRARYDPIATGLRLAAALHRAYPDEWDAAPLERMLGRHDVYEAFLRGADEPALEALWQGDLEAFAARRARYVAASPAAASPAAGSVRGEVGSGH